MSPPFPPMSCSICDLFRNTPRYCSDISLYRDWERSLCCWKLRWYEELVYTLLCNVWVTVDLVDTSNFCNRWIIHKLGMFILLGSPRKSRSWKYKKIQVQARNERFVSNLKFLAWSSSTCASTEDWPISCRHTFQNFRGNFLLKCAGFSCSKNIMHIKFHDEINQKRNDYDKFRNYFTE